MTTEETPAPRATSKVRRMGSSAIRLAVIGGDGIGPEVVAEALKVLKAAAVTVDATSYDLGAQRWHRTGETLPDSALEEIRGHDAILLGAVGDPTVPSGVLERGPAAAAAVRAGPLREPAAGPAVPGRGHARWPGSGRRRSTWWSCGRVPRGRTPGAGGVLRKGTPAEVATQESLNTAFGVEPGGQVRVRARRAAAAASTHPGAQDERARPTPATCGSAPWPRRPGVPRGLGRLLPRGRGLDVLGHRSPSGST